MHTMKKMLFTGNKLIVAAAVIGLCTGTLTPAFAVEKGDAKFATAAADMKALKAALDRFRTDNAAWPNRVNGSDPTTNTAEVLFSEGNAIASPSTWPVDNPEVYKQLTGYFGAGNDRNYPAGKWKGPYLSKTTADPWGNTYLIGVKNLEKNELPVWIISAGPDGALQTPIDSPVCMDGKSLDPGTGLVAPGDDICLKFK